MEKEILILEVTGLKVYKTKSKNLMKIINSFKVINKY